MWRRLGACPELATMTYWRSVRWISGMLLSVWLSATAAAQHLPCTVWEYADPINGPSARDLAPMVFNPVIRRVMMSTGNADWGVDSDSYSWDGTRWISSSVGSLTPRFGAAMAYDSARNRAVLFGG